MSDDPVYLQKEFVLRHLLGLPSLFCVVWEKIERFRVFHETGDLEWIWNAALSYWQKFSRLPSGETLVLDLRCVLTDSGLSQYEPELTDKVRYWFSKDTDDASQIMVEELLKGFFSEAAQTELQLLLRRGLSPEELKEHLSGFSSTIAAGSLSRPQEKNPFWGRTIEDYLGEIQRQKTGVDFVDNALGGGVILGDAGAFVMPSKGGKTTLNFQFIRECVFRREHCLALSFEQLMEGDLARRCYVLSTGTTRKDWDKGLDGVPAEIVERWQKAAPFWGYYFHFYDHWVDPQNPMHSIGEIYRLVEDYQKQDIRIRWVMLDWWGPLLRKLLQSNPVRSDWEKRQKEAQWLGEVKAYSQKLGLNTFLFHQLAGMEAGKAVTHVASSFRAQENSAFNNMLDWCFVSSRKDSNGDVLFKLDVARSADTSGKIRVHLDGARCQFTGRGPDFAATTLTDMHSSARGGATLVQNTDKEFMR